MKRLNNNVWINCLYFVCLFCTFFSLSISKCKNERLNNDLWHDTCGRTCLWYEKYISSNVNQSSTICNTTSHYGGLTCPPISKSGDSASVACCACGGGSEAGGVQLVNTWDFNYLALVFAILTLALLVIMILRCLPNNGLSAWIAKLTTDLNRESTRTRPSDMPNEEYLPIDNYKHEKRKEITTRRTSKSSTMVRGTTDLEMISQTLQKKPTEVSHTYIMSDTTLQPIKEHVRINFGPARDADNDQKEAPKSDHITGNEYEPIKDYRRHSIDGGTLGKRFSIEWQRNHHKRTLVGDHEPRSTSTMMQPHSLGAKTSLHSPNKTRPSIMQRTTNFRNKPSTWDCQDDLNHFPMEDDQIENRTRGDTMTRFSFMSGTREATMSSIISPTKQIPSHIVSPSREGFTRTSRNRTRGLKELGPEDEIRYELLNMPKAELIGEGKFGKVYKTKYKNKTVAVKMLHNQNLKQMEKKWFRREANIMKWAGPHDNIVQFLGICTTEGHICIITDYYSNGSLYDMLFSENKRINLTTARKLDMARQAALGVQHLHEKDVVHRDICTRNLLVSNDMRIVVADFGMSQLKQNNVKYESNETDSSVGVPVRWLAPECIMFDDYSRKSDVYAFAITLYELFAEKRPYETLTTAQVAALVVHMKQRPDIENIPVITSIPDLKSLIINCWDSSRDRRPLFEEIVENLKIISKQYPLK